MDVPLPLKSTPYRYASTNFVPVIVAPLALAQPFVNFPLNEHPPGSTGFSPKKLAKVKSAPLSDAPARFTFLRCACVSVAEPTSFPSFVRTAARMLAPVRFALSRCAPCSWALLKSTHCFLVAGGGGRHCRLAPRSDAWIKLACEKLVASRIALSSLTRLSIAPEKLRPESLVKHALTSAPVRLKLRQSSMNSQFIVAN